MSLRDLDDRFAASGPLGLVRDVPQLGLLVVTAVFLAGSAAALTMREDAARPTSAREQPGAQGLPTELGPPVGSSVDEHLARARERALDAARSDPRGRHLALVSLRDERSPAEVQQLLTRSSLPARRVYLRAPVPGGDLVDVLPVDVEGELLSPVRRELAQAAQRKAEEQREFTSLAESIDPGTAEEREFRAFYEAAARTAGEEAAVYRGPCACAFAVVVEGTARQLADLATVPEVRGVELAARDAALEDLQISPLPPDVTGVVQAPAQVPGKP